MRHGHLKSPVDIFCRRVRCDLVEDRHAVRIITGFGQVGQHPLLVSRLTQPDIGHQEQPFSPQFSRPAAQRGHGAGPGLD